MVINYDFNVICRGCNEISYFFINLIPNLDYTAIKLSDSLALLAPVLSIFPLDLFKFIFYNGMAWAGFHLMWSLFEWVYKKIPGVS